MNALHKSFLGAAILLAVSGPVLADPQSGNSSSGMIALNSLPNPPQTLANAHVVDAKGLVVGAVQKVVMDARGQPVTVDVSLLGTSAVVAMEAGKFNYDEGHNILTAQLDAQQIAQEPRAPQG